MNGPIRRRSGRLLRLGAMLGLLAAALASSRIVAQETATLDEPAIRDSDRSHWAFRARREAEPPAVRNPQRLLSSLDRFVQAELESLDLALQPSADRATLLRRLSFDLIGLPPSPEAIARFRDDHRVDAYERQVDRLLSSAEYGRRWAQHWLELARYAETDGFEHDKVRAEAWRYRDWVIDALNQDMAYSRFVSLQIAGDLLEPDLESSRWATGFCTSGPDMPDINSKVERSHNLLNEITATVGAVFLGLQAGCAQCHDHKYDPISQADFYRLRSFFDGTVALKKNQSIGWLEKPKTTPVSRLMIRGDWRRPGPAVAAAIPRVLRPAGEIARQRPRDRADFARWLSSLDHELATRVFVNRIWQHHFGEGLSRTPSDFGVLGDEPIHLDLLDHLADYLKQHDGSIKALHRYIVTSATYRQVSRCAEPAGNTDWQRALEKDPRNLYWSRYPRRRLEGEAIRDAMLFVAGRLNSAGCGPGVRPPLPEELVKTLLRNQWEVSPDPDDHLRRSVFLFARRNLRYPIFEAFDRPDANTSCPSRSRSTTAPQSLMLLNGKLSIAMAQHAAGRVLASHANEEKALEAAFLRIVGREPNAAEVDACKRFLVAQSQRCEELLNDDADSILRQPIPVPGWLARPRAVAWTDLCLALFNSSAFVYVD